MKVLKTSYEMKRELGKCNVYRHLVNQYDIKFRERKATEKIGKRLKPHRCATCGRKASSTYRLEVAHITSLAECSGTNVSNLLLLCKERHPKRGKGCHTLYDQGFCSIVDMVKCQEDRSANRPPKLRKKMESLAERYGYQPQQQGYLRKRLKQLCEDQKDYRGICLIPLKGD